MKQGHTLRTRFFSWLLTASIIAGMIPTTAFAIELGKDETSFDPSSQEAEISFKLQREQYVNIEVYVDGELFGYIAKGLLLHGYDPRYDNTLFIDADGNARPLYPEEEVPQVSMNSDLTRNFLADQTGSHIQPEDALPLPQENAAEPSNEEAPADAVPDVGQEADSTDTAAEQLEEALLHEDEGHDSDSEKEELASEPEFPAKTADKADQDDTDTPEPAEPDEKEPESPVEPFPEETEDTESEPETPPKEDHVPPAESPVSEEPEIPEVPEAPAFPIKPISAAEYADMVSDLDIRIADAMDTDVMADDEDTVAFNDAGRIVETSKGNFTVHWTGRVAYLADRVEDTYAVMARDSESDQVDVTIRVQPLGYPQKNKDCRDVTNADGSTTHIHGENWTWTQAQTVEGSLTVDYRMYSLLAIANGLYYDDGMVQEVLGWLGVEDISDIRALNPNGIDFSPDPVKLMTGAYNFSYTDLRLEGSYPLSFVRMYNSVTPGGSLGQGFTHSYDYRLTEDRGLLSVSVPYGEELHFVRYQPGFGTGYYSLRNSGFTLEDSGSGWEMTYRKGTVFSFDSDGRLTSLTSPQGLTLTTLSYDGDELTEIRGIAGSFDLSWENGHIIQVTDSAGRKTRYDYDGENLIAVTNPDGDTLQYSYDANGYLREAVDFNDDTTVQNTYDELGRVTGQTFYNAGVPVHSAFTYDGTEGDLSIHTYTNSSGYTMSYYYDKYSQLVRTVDGDGNVTAFGYDQYLAGSLKDAQSNSVAYEFDDRGNVSKATYPDGAVVRYTYSTENLVTSIAYEDGTEHYGYDGNGFLTSYTDKRGNTTYYGYENGVQTSVTDAAGNTTIYSYDADARLTAIFYPDGGETRYDRDAVGRITAVSVKIHDGETATTRYEYTDSGKLAKVTDAEGGVTAYEYDGNGFITSTKDANGGISTTEYAINGQPIRETDANSNVTSYSYNENGLLESVTDPEGNTTRYDYDPSRKLTSVTDAAGNETKYTYDSLDRLVKITDALGGKTSYTYDAMGRRTSETDAEGHTTSYTYDHLGRLTQLTNAMGGKTSYTYDPNGNLLQTTDANGNSTSGSYDALNRITSEVDGEGNITAYGYDSMGRVTAVTNALNGVTRYTYDLAGNLLTRTDPAGNTTAFQYDKLGRRVAQINADNSRQSFAYDPMGNLLKHTDELGHETVYTYDAAGDLLTAKDPLDHTTAYSYNRNRQVAAITYPDGGTVSYTYNSLGLTASQTNQRGYTTTLLYDELGRISEVTDAEGIVTAYTYDGVGNLLTTAINGTVTESNTYDALDRLVFSTNGLGHGASCTYDKVGNLTVYKDREGNTTRYRYDRNDTLTEITDAEGGVTTTTYDALGRVVSETDANGSVTAYTYDANGNLLAVVDAMGGTVSNTYDHRNRVVSTANQLGTVTVYSYDAAGNLLTATDATGHVTKRAYDANNNLIQSTNRENEWAKYAYDACDRLVQETNQLNHATKIRYDLCGNITATVDGNGSETVYAYDGLNRLISQTDPEGGIAEYTYDAFGNVDSLTVYGGNNEKATTRYAYDLAGNLLSETSPLGYITAYEYDQEGNAVRKTDGNGKATTFGYDKLYRLTSRTDDDGTASFVYDAVGNLTEASDATDTVEFGYDALYRTTQVTNADSSVTSYTYDAAGNRLSITYPDGKAVTTAYDILGNVNALTDHDGKGISYTRDAEGRVTKEDHTDGSTTEYDYNAAGLLTMQKEVTAGNRTRRQITYAYDDAGRLTSENRSGVDVGKRDELARYYYDKAGRLVKTTLEGKTTSYAYDLAGNIISDGESTYTYDLQNRLLTKTGPDGTTSCTYDAAGNLIKKAAPDGTTEYTYTAQNRLKAGTQSDGQSSAYTYNALGVRTENVQIRKNENAGYANADLKDGSHDTDYLRFLKDFRANWQRVFESEVGTTHQNDFETVTKHYIVDYLSEANRDILVTEDGSYTQRHVYDENSRRISAEFNYADGTARGTTNAKGEYGENLQSDFAAQDIRKVWYRTSHLGSTLITVNEAGTVIGHTIYDPWGAPLTETYPDTNFAPLDNANNFTGYTWDEVLGLYFAQNRFYGAANHRFTQEDPMRDDTNWYAYCGDDPLNYVDPYGYSEFWMTKKDVQKEREKGTRWANWEKLLSDAAQPRILELSKNLTEQERYSAIDEIYYSEAEKLQQEFRTQYEASKIPLNPSHIIHTTLDPLYNDYQRPKEPTLGDAAVRGFEAGYKVGRNFAIWEWWYGSKYQCVDKKAKNSSTMGGQGKTEAPNSPADYTYPNGGGGTTQTIHIGKQEIRFGHGGRHLEGTGLSSAEVNKAIAKEVSRLNIEPQQFYKGRITVNGITIEYTSFGLKNGAINVGTYYPIK